MIDRFFGFDHDWKEVGIERVKKEKVDKREKDRRKITYHGIVG